MQKYISCSFAAPAAGGWWWGGGEVAVPWFQSQRPLSVSLSGSVQCEGSRLCMRWGLLSPKATWGCSGGLIRGRWAVVKATSFWFIHRMGVGIFKKEPEIMAAREQPTHIPPRKCGPLKQRKQRFKCVQSGLPGVCIFCIYPPPTPPQPLTPFHTRAFASVWCREYFSVSPRFLMPRITALLWQFAWKKKKDWCKFLLCEYVSRLLTRSLKCKVYLFLLDVYVWKPSFRYVDHVCAGAGQIPWNWS